MTLLLRRVLRAEAEAQRGWFRTRTVTRLRLGQLPALPPHEAAVVRLVQSASHGQPAGPTVELVVAAARRQYGPALDRFRQDLVLPALTGRKLVEVRATGLLGIRRPALTPSGTAARARLQDLLDRGRMVPRWLDSDPRQAALAAAALGPLVLLVDELKPHLKRLASAMPRRDDGGDGGGSSGSEGLDCHHPHKGGSLDAAGPGAGTPDPGASDPGAFGLGGFDYGALDAAAFDTGSFDALDSAMSSFDAATGRRRPWRRRAAEATAMGVEGESDLHAGERCGWHGLTSGQVASHLEPEPRWRPSCSLPPCSSRLRWVTSSFPTAS